MRNQDLVLVAQAGLTPRGTSAGEASSLVVHAPDVLPDTLARLFAADIPPERSLTSLHRLCLGPAALLDYLTACAAVPAAATPPVQQPDAVLSLTALRSVIDHAPLAELLVLRTGMRSRPGSRLSLAERLVPAFRCIEFSFAALNLGPLVSQATSDPFLCRHLSAGLDFRLIGLLSDDIAQGGALTRQAISTGMPVHFELGVSALVSPEYARLARQAADVGLRFGVAIPLMQACADIDRLETARQVLAMSGGELVISRLQPSQMMLANPASLGPGLVKLTWSASLLEDGAAGCPAQLPQLDPARIVLQGVDCPHAVAWGQARGLLLYEGPFLDQIQAARRMDTCEHAECCTLGQCCDRARAAGRWGRTGCREPALLDADGAPAQAMEHAA